MDNQVLRDGHIHTPLCPHGSLDPFEAYIHKAIEMNRVEMTFTEHFPLPYGIVENEFRDDCCMQEEQIPDYIQKVSKLKNVYKDSIKINLGFEVDFIEGYEESIKKDLSKYGNYIEDSILSVHFLKSQGQYICLDDLDGFEKLVQLEGSVEKVYNLYYKTVLKSILADLGRYKPKRIGHPTLVRIFNKKYPCSYENEQLFKEIIEALKQKKMEIDYNVAGIRKPYCKETYPSGRLLQLILANNIPYIYGSDAHEAKHMELLK